MSILTRKAPPDTVARSGAALAAWADEQGKAVWTEAEARLAYDLGAGRTKFDRMRAASALRPEDLEAMNLAEIAVKTAEARVGAAERAVAKLVAPSVQRAMPRDEDGNPMFPDERTMKRWEREDIAARREYAAAGPRLRMELVQAEGDLEMARLGAHEAKFVAEKARRERLANVKDD